MGLAAAAGLAWRAAGAFGAGTAASAPLAGQALDRLGHRRVLPLLAAGFAAALAVIALVSGHLGAGAVIGVVAVAGLARPRCEPAGLGWCPGLTSTRRTRSIPPRRN